MENIDKLTTRLEITTDEKVSITRKLDKATVQLNNTNNEKLAQSKEVGQVLNQLKTSNESLRNLEAEKARIEDERVALQQRFNDMRAQNIESETQAVLALEGNTQLLEVKLATAKTDLERLSSEKDGLLENIDQLTTRLEITNDEKDAIDNKKLKQANKNLSSVRDENLRLKQKNEVIGARCKSLEKEIYLLRSAMKEIERASPQKSNNNKESISITEKNLHPSNTVLEVEHTVDENESASKRYQKKTDYISGEDSTVTNISDNGIDLKTQLQKAHDLNNKLLEKQTDLETRIESLLDEHRILVTEQQKERTKRTSLEKDQRKYINMEEKHDFDHKLPISFDSITDAYDLYIQEKLLRLDVCAEKAALIIAHDKDRSQLLAHHEATMNAFYAKLSC